MMRASPKFAIVCLTCNKDFNKVDNAKMTKTIEGDLIIECSVCGIMERYIFKKE